MSEELEPKKRGKGGRIPRKPELRVVLDTNQLFTTSASDFLRKELADLISDSRRHDDVSLVWLVPEVVRLERHYQMRESGKLLLGPVAKLERLLGYGLGINEDILIDRVDAAIEKQMALLGLKSLALETTRVDWDRVIKDSVGRRPPFDSGKNEKGFRDAVIAETFLQLVEKSPKTASICRVALVTDDGLLGDAVSARTRELTNVRILRSLDELRDLVNTIVGDVTEDFVNLIRDAAGPCFFEAENKKALFYTSSVREQISQRFGAELRTVPGGAETRKNGTWYIGAPRFDRKARQRVHWVSTVRVAAKAYRNERPPDYGFTTMREPLTTNPVLGGTFLSAGGNLSIGGMATIPDYAFHTSGGTGTLGSLTGLGALGRSIITPPTNEVLVVEGQSVFEVLWSVTVTAGQKLVSPSVDGINFIETTWQGSPAA